jgi:hypothetical protein
MKFKTHNQKEIKTGGTSLMGYVNVGYKKLKKVFGEPTESDGYKSDAEWEIEFEDETIATIYNYKDGKNYLGEDGIDTAKITDWHIGGNDIKTIKLVKEALGVK